VNYFVSQAFRAPNHPDHIPLSKVEDLLSGDPLLISCLLLLLLKRWSKVHKGNLSEPFLHKILGIIKRSGLKSTDPHVSLELKELLAQIEGVTYNANHDPLPNDSFGPINSNCLKVSPSINVHFVDTEDKVSLLDRLVGAPMIGMDSEWRPSIKPFTEQRLAIFQVSSETDAFIIDLIALANNHILDAKLIEIFTDERSLCIGFAFGSDTSMFKESLPKMQFFKRFSRFLDV